MPRFDKDTARTERVLLARGATMCRLFLQMLVIVAALSLNGCASLSGREPVQVTLANIESLPGEGLEVRMMVKLRVQNPNDMPVEYDGVYVRLDVLNRTLATGVSDERGVVPRFGESVIAVPVTVSALRVALHALGFVLDGKPVGKISYNLSGRLNGPGLGSVRFQDDRELTLPKP
jgi:LEA14-like dessication related protein